MSEHSRWTVRPCQCAATCSVWRVTRPDGAWTLHPSRDAALGFIPPDERHAALRDLEGAEPRQAPNTAPEHLVLLDPTTPGGKIHLDSGVTVLGGMHTYDKPRSVCGRAFMADKVEGIRADVTCRLCLSRKRRG